MNLAGIAAYKSCELLRLLQKKGAEVRVCMTEAATQFVAPLTFASLSKCPVYLKNGAVEARPFQHIDFPRWADLYLVVPATANVIGKFVYGIADDPVSLCFMSCTGPRFIAPAMNVAMFNSPAVKRNLETLRSFENTFVMDSPAGELACGEVGKTPQKSWNIWKVQMSCRTPCHPGFIPGRHRLFHLRQIRHRNPSS